MSDASPFNLRGVDFGTEKSCPAFTVGILFPVFVVTPQEVV